MGFQGTAVNGTGIASYLLSRLRKVPVLVLLPQNDQAGVDAVARWVEKLPRGRLLDHHFREGEKDLNDQIRARGLEKIAAELRQSLKAVNVEV